MKRVNITKAVAFLSVLLVLAWFSSCNIFLPITTPVTGQVDSSFGIQGYQTTAIGTFRDRIYALVLQKDGKVLALGESLADSSKSSFAVARYLANGQIDTLFGTAGTVRFALNSIKRNIFFAGDTQSDGKIVVTGTVTGGTDNTIIVARLLPDGQLDTTFGSAGTGYVSPDLSGTAPCKSSGTFVKVLPSGGILIGAGYFDAANSYFSAIRLKANGTPDTTYGDNGLGFKSISTADSSDFDKYPSFVYDERGALTGFGSVNHISHGARFTADGKVDTTFGTNGLATFNATTHLYMGNLRINGVALLSDGAYIVVGARVDPAFESHMIVFKVTSAGLLDVDDAVYFGDPSTPGLHEYQYPGNNWDALTSVLSLPDGRIVACGYGWASFTESPVMPTATEFGILLILDSSGNITYYNGSDGMKDIYLRDTADSMQSMFAMCLKPDGKIILGGECAEGHTFADDPDSFSITAGVGIFKFFLTSFH